MAGCVRNAMIVLGDMEPGVQDGWLNEKIMRKQRATKKKIMSLIIRKKCKDREGDKKT